MSLDVSVFFSGPASVEAASALLLEVLQLSFLGAGTIESPFRADQAGFSFVLITDHELEPDGGINFAEYQFQLNLRPNSPSRGSAEAAQSALARYFRDILRTCGCSSIAIEDLERVLD
jgi:hypothetical protein